MMLKPPSLKPIRTKAMDPEAAAMGMGSHEEEESFLGMREPLSPTSMLFHDPRVHNTILAVMGSSKEINVDQAKAALEATLVRHPRFSSIQEWDCSGKAHWVRTKVNIDNHVIAPELNPMTIPSPDLFIEDYLSNLSTSMLDFSKPLWEVHILNLPTSKANATILLRIHHSMGDGISLISLLVDCSTNCSSNSNDMISIIPCKGRMEQKITSTTTVDNTYWWKCSLKWFLLRLVIAWNTVLASLFLLFTALGWVKDTETVVSAGTEDKEFNRRHFVNMTVSLEDLRLIKRTVGATINDVVLGFVSAGLWKYISRRYEKLGITIPTDIRIRSAVMVNLRKSTRIQAFPHMMDRGKNNPQWGNKIGFLLIPLPIVQFDCPLDYVKSAKVRVDKKKSSMEARFIHFTGYLLTKIFGSKVVSEMFYRLMSNITMVISNIPGPTEEIEFCGHRLSHPALTVYGFPQAISIHCLSYVDNMRIFLAVDGKIIPDAQQLCKDLMESLNSIKEAAMRVGPSM